MDGVKTVGSQEVRTTLFRQNALELRPQLKVQRHHVQGDIWVADRHQAGEFPPRLHHWHGTQCCGRTCPLRRIDQLPKVLGKPILPFSGGSRGNLKRDGVEAVVVTFHMPTDQRLEMISGECHALRSLPVPPGRAPRITSHSGRTDTDRGLHSVLTILRPLGPPGPPMLTATQFRHSTTGLTGLGEQGSRGRFLSGQKERRDDHRPACS